MPGEMSPVDASGAEGAGFDPANLLRGCWFSRPVQSAALPPLRQLQRLAVGGYIQFNAHLQSLAGDGEDSKRTGLTAGAMMDLFRLPAAPAVSRSLRRRGTTASSSPWPSVRQQRLESVPEGR